MELYPPRIYSAQEYAGYTWAESWSGGTGDNYGHMVVAFGVPSSSEYVPVLGTINPAVFSAPYGADKAIYTELTAISSGTVDRIRVLATAKANVKAAIS